MSSATMNPRCGTFASDACNHEMLFATKRAPIAKNQLQSIINVIQFLVFYVVFIVVQYSLYNNYNNIIYSMLMCAWCHISNIIQAGAQ